MKPVLLMTALLPFAASAVQAQDATVVVQAKRKPADEWKDYPTRTLEGLKNYTPAPAVALDRFGGWADHKQTATGFFHAQKIGDRWWLIDPDGNLFLHAGIVGVSSGGTDSIKSAMTAKFGSKEKWAESAAQMLHANGFNGTGAWTDTAALRATTAPPVYTLIWDFMSSYGKKRGGTFQATGHTGYPNNLIFVFDPDFPKFCDERAKQLAAFKDDPYLLGHFSDNELPFPNDALDKYLALPPEDAGHQAAAVWLNEHKGHTATTAEITADDRIQFRRFVVSRYFEITTTAMRKYDPNHLMLGSRLHGSDLSSNQIFAAAGQWLDVVAVNYYGAWTPDAAKIAGWVKAANKPFLVTEWYVKGSDVPGLNNSSGAGWIVPTQSDRGLFYQNFALGLLESKNCVGWHWFKYMDNDPTDLKSDPSNRDSNKGVVSIGFEAYQPLLDKMRALNAQIYPLTSYFDTRPQPAPSAP